jgi:hypothetical protein
MVGNEDGPWAKWWAADVAMDRFDAPAARLARTIKPFGVKSKRLRIGAENVRGFEREAFADVFATYLPEPGTSGTPGTLQVGPTSDVPPVPLVPPLGEPATDEFSEDPGEAQRFLRAWNDAAEAQAREHPPWPEWPKLGEVIG